MNYEKKSDQLKTHKQSLWNDHIMERFIKANLFIICCVAAGLLLIVYLAAFSCEVSWILEAHGELPVSAYILCTQFFIVFVATTILIHGLVTGLPWGLFAWSVVIGFLSIPELIFVMIMTTQHWGLQSVHGLTELISYLIRLIINCLSLICVIPTGLRWRRESQVLVQLQDLAIRLQLQTPPPSAPIIQSESSRRSSKRMQMQKHTGFENGGCNEPTSQSHAHRVFNSQNINLGSQNEFNASIFVPLSNGFIEKNGNRTQSLMDLRCTLPGMYNPRYVLDIEDKSGKYFNITLDDLKNNMQETNKHQAQTVCSSSDPIYCSIEPKPYPTALHQDKRDIQLQQKPPAKLSRNCISLENLNGVAKIQKDLAAYETNYLRNYTQQQQYYLAMLSGCLNPPHNFINGNRRPSLSSGADAGMERFSNAMIAPPLQRCNSQQLLQYYGSFGYANCTNPYITANSKLSLGNESDDYRKYRDVAL